MAKLQEFWQQMRDAPDDIRSIVENLDLLSAILREIAFRAQQTVAVEPTLIKAIESCARRMEILQDIANELLPPLVSGSRFSRKWSAVKAARKEEKLRQFRSCLEETKTSLLLVQQHSQQ
jgi:hypothetical protein